MTTAKQRRRSEKKQAAADRRARDGYVVVRCEGCGELSGLTFARGGALLRPHPLVPWYVHAADTDFADPCHCQSWTCTYAEAA